MIHGRDGKIQSKDSDGRDLIPPRDIGVFLFVDTGLLDQVLASSDMYNKFFEAVYENATSLSKSQELGIVPSSFSVLEYVGIKITSVEEISNNGYKSIIDKIDNAISKNNRKDDDPKISKYIRKLIYEYLKKLFENYNKKIRDSKCFTKEKIKKKIQEKIDNKPENMRDSWQKFLPTEISNDLEEAIIRDISLDRIINHKYPNSNDKGENYAIRALVMTLLFSEMVHHIRDGANNSFGRMINNQCNILIGNNDKDCIKNLVDKARFGSNKDLVDTEIIHFAVVGYHYKKKRYPVECYTSDDEGLIKTRVFLYLKLIDISSKEAKKMGFEKEALSNIIKPSKITFYRDNCIVNCLDIKKFAIKEGLVFTDKN